MLNKRRNILFLCVMRVGGGDNLILYIIYDYVLIKPKNSLKYYSLQKWVFGVHLVFGDCDLFGGLIWMR